MKRPDGSDLNAYAGWESWTPRRWAWEFLRRNEKFIEECKQADTAKDPKAQKERQKKIKETFHLAQYLSYRSNGFDKVRFRTSDTVIRANVERKGKVRKHTIHCFPGQVWVRFDLNGAQHASRALQAQVEHAHARLTKLLSQFEKSAPVRKPSKPKVHGFLRHLIILDRIASGITEDKAVATALRLCANLDPQEDKSSHRNRNWVAQAKSYAAQGYLEVAAMAFKGAKQASTPVLRSAAERGSNPATSPGAEDGCPAGNDRGSGGNS